MLIIGHRGGDNNIGENTLGSFEKAIELGADMIELDVHLTKDNHLVVLHDRKVDRTTDGKGLVSDKTLEEVRALNAGNGEKIPTLEEVIELIDRKVPINIELKALGSAEKVCEVIRLYVSKGWIYDDFLVSSFEHNELHHFSEICPEVKIGVLMGDIPLGYAEYVEKLGAYSANIALEAASPKFIEDAHQRGLKVFVWTVNDLEDITLMKKLGVDGIFTDFPDKAKTV
ncbi:MAG: glycerophosphodiester phosphodiesterase family protein [Candidatus Colwellbacteria bacterium]|nr:glycerophosphodiester phosphodiesterase family protein [Candidatus Colwellbacteria bacterium]